MKIQMPHLEQKHMYALMYHEMCNRQSNGVYSIPDQKFGRYIIHIMKDIAEDNQVLALTRRCRGKV